MTLGNTSSRYGSVSRTLHWLTAFVVLAAIPLGLLANRLPYATDAEIARTFVLFSAHKTLGIAALVLGLSRIGWSLVQPRPAPLHPERKWETLLSTAVHWTLSLGLVLVPLAGWFSHAAIPGLAPIWWPFGQSVIFIPEDPWLGEAFGTIHRTASKLLVGALILHLAGATKHAFLDHDATMSRMVSGVEAGGGKPVSRGPLFTAAGLWSITLAGGLALALFGTSNADLPAQEWPFETGEINLVDSAGKPLGTATDFGFALALAPDGRQSEKGTLDISFPVDALEGDGVDSALAMIPFPLLQFYGTVSGEPPGLEAKGTMDAGGTTADGTLGIDLREDAAVVLGSLPVPGAPDLTLQVEATAKRP